MLVIGNDYLEKSIASNTKNITKNIFRGKDWHSEYMNIELYLNSDLRLNMEMLKKLLRLSTYKKQCLFPFLHL